MLIIPILIRVTQSEIISDNEEPQTFRCSCEIEWKSFLSNINTNNPMNTVQFSKQQILAMITRKEINIPYSRIAFNFDS